MSVIPLREDWGRVECYTTSGGKQYRLGLVTRVAMPIKDCPSRTKGGRIQADGFRLAGRQKTVPFLQTVRPRMTESSVQTSVYGSDWSEAGVAEPCVASSIVDHRPCPHISTRLAGLLSLAGPHRPTSTWCVAIGAVTRPSARSLEGKGF
jgi:hypothetical protein